MLDRLTRGVVPWLLLLLLSAALFLPGLASLPVIDRDEARFAQATRQMIVSGDFLDIRFQDEARNKKPAGIYWLQAGFVGLFGAADVPQIWPFRLASTAGATLAVLLTFGLGTRLFDRRTAFVAAILTASTIMLVVEAHLAKTDAVLLAAATAAQGALGVLYVRRRREAKAPGVARAREGWGLPLLFWAAEGVAILVKGPVVPAIGALTVLALIAMDRRVRWLGVLKPRVGAVVMLAIFLPWLIAIEWKTGGAFVQQSVGQDMWGKLVGAQESHGAPPGYYALLVFVTFWPASYLLLPGLVQGWRERGDPAVRFLAAWLLPAWLMFELVPTKLPHYTLPLYPALALLSARGLLAMSSPPRDEAEVRTSPGGNVGRRRWSALASASIWALVAGLLALALLVLPVRLGLLPPASAVLDAALLLGAAGSVVRDLRRGTALASPSKILALVAVAALTVLPATLALTLPRLDPVWLSRSVAEAHPTAPLVSVGYTEPSLVFLLGTGTRLIADAGAADIIAGEGGGSALVAGDHEAGFAREIAARGFRLEKLATFHGLDYSSGRWMDLALYDARRR